MSVSLNKLEHERSQKHEGFFMFGARIMILSRISNYTHWYWNTSLCTESGKNKSDSFHTVASESVALYLLTLATSLAELNPKGASPDEIGSSDPSPQTASINNVCILVLQIGHKCWPSPLNNPI